MKNIILILLFILYPILSWSSDTVHIVVVETVYVELPDTISSDTMQYLPELTKEDWDNLNKYLQEKGVETNPWSRENVDWQLWEINQRLEMIQKQIDLMWFEYWWDQY